MTACKHDELDFVGKQKTDLGVNTYVRCRKCGDLLVILPGDKVIAIHGVSLSAPPPEH